MRPKKTLDETLMEHRVKDMLSFIGENPDREGLKDTPKRFIRAFKKLFEGYNIKVEDILTTFDSEGYNEMVILKDIEFYSTCEHHILPFFGKAHIAYIPNGRIAGISKLARIVDIYARRLQNQERLTDQISQAITKHLNPKGVAVVLEAKHLCMMARGVEKQNSIMKTSKLTGVFLEKKNLARQEFLALISNK